jgi:hypothetical protein
MIGLVARASLVFALGAGTARVARGQAAAVPRSEVVLTVSERSDPRLASAFASALGALPDVDVLSSAEDPDYVLRVVASCYPSDDCRSAASYSVAVEVSEPLHAAAVDLPLQLVLKRNRLRLSRQVAGQVGRDLSAQLGDYEAHKALRVFNWGVDSLRSAVKDFVSRFNQECLERGRMLYRARVAAVAGDTLTWRTLLAEVSRSHSDSDIC